MPGSTLGFNRAGTPPKPLAQQPARWTKRLARRDGSRMRAKDKNMKYFHDHFRQLERDRHCLVCRIPIHKTPEHWRYCSQCFQGARLYSAFKRYELAMRGQE